MFGGDDFMMKAEVKFQRKKYRTEYDVLFDKIGVKLIIKPRQMRRMKRSKNGTVRLKFENILLDEYII